MAADAYGVLLTLDSWLQVDSHLRRASLDAARILVADEPEVLEEDMRPIIFTSMQDLADVMIVSTEDQFLTTLADALLKEFDGWDLREVRRKAGDENEGTFPFDIADLMPWWGQLKDRR